MNNTNKFISSDNVGYASMLLEQEYNKDSMVGKGSFVGAFCSSNLGDVSPNIMGPKCMVGTRIQLTIKVLNLKI
jgi:neutral ceramidase